MTDYNELMEEYVKTAAPFEKEHDYYRILFYAVDQIRMILVSTKENLNDEDNYTRFLFALREFLDAMGVYDNE